LLPQIEAKMIIPSPCEKRSGEVFPQQGQRDHQLTEQPSEGSGPPAWLWRVLWQNGYPANLIHSTSAPPHPYAGIGPQYSPERDQKESRPLVTMIPYVAGMSDDIRCVCRHQSSLQVWMDSLLIVNQGQGYTTHG